MGKINNPAGNPDISTESPKGLRGLPPTLPKSKPKKPKVEHAYGGKKMKMASYYSKGGTVFTGR